MAADYGSLPFDAQIAFFRKKLALPTKAWDDIWQENHNHAFVVAGANRIALVEGFQAAVQKAIEKGTTIADFRKDFDTIVAQHGWDYKGGRGWRTRIIYETNIRMSHAAGRFTQLQRLPIWQYHHSHAVANPREQHVAWDGIVLRRDDQFWQTHYPPNGWGCRCFITGMSEARMKRKGLRLSDSPQINTVPVTIGKRSGNPRTVDVPEGIDAGFAYAAGRDTWMQAHIPRPKGAPAHGFDRLIPATVAHDLLPDPTLFLKSNILPAMEAGQEEAYAKKFLQEFGADIGKPAVFTDVAGETIVIDEGLFKTIKGKWKIAKRGRERFLLMLAEAIKNPDEIWAVMEWNNALSKAMVRRRYIARFTVEGSTVPALAVFEIGRDGWFGKTTYAADQAMDELDAEIANLRRGVRLHQR